MVGKKPNYIWDKATRTHQIPDAWYVVYFFSFLISERIPEFLKEEMMQLQDSDDKLYEDLATGEDLEFWQGNMATYQQK